MFRKDTPHYIVTMFGMLTGVAATGLALLRGIDPYLEKDTADNVVVLGSAIAAPIGFPMMILLGFPIVAYNTGLNYYNYIMVAGLFSYLLLLIFIMVYRKENLKGNLYGCTIHSYFFVNKFVIIVIFREKSLIIKKLMFILMHCIKY